MSNQARSQPIIALYFEFETVLKFYNLGAWSKYVPQYPDLSGSSPGSIVHFVALVCRTLYNKLFTYMRVLLDS